MRTLATLAPLVLLSALTAQLNHYLASIQVHLFVSGMFVAFAALRVPRQSTLTAVLLAGLWIDASTPVAFGTNATLFAIAYLVILRLRERVPRDETFVTLTVALVANLGMFLAISFRQVGDAPVASTAWLRLLVDLVFSQIVVALVSPWFFALQHRTLQLARLERAV